MNWRTWLYNRLAGAPELTLPIYGAGSLTTSPKTRPFLVLRLGLGVSEIDDGDKPMACSIAVDIWCHDEPGSYDQIDSVLNTVQDVLVGPVPVASGIACRWEGDSGELSDDALGTIVRTSSFRLIGRR